MRKATYVLAIFSLLASLFIAGCGDNQAAGSKLPDPQATTSTSTDTTGFSLLIAEDHQEMELPKDADNNIQGVLGLGTRTLKPEQVKEVVATSWRLGDANSSPARGPLTNLKGVVTASLENTLNNEDPISYWLVLYTGEKYQVNPTLFKGRIKSTMTGLEYGFYGDSSMYYWRSQLADKNTYFNAKKNGELVTLTIHQGCNRFLWLTGVDAGLPRVSRIVYKATDGSRYLGTTVDDGYGDYVTTIIVPSVISGNVMAEVDSDNVTVGYPFDFTGDKWWVQYDYKSVSVTMGNNGMLSIDNSHYYY